MYASQVDICFSISIEHGDYRMFKSAKEIKIGVWLLKTNVFEMINISNFFLTEDVFLKKNVRELSVHF